MVCTEAVATCLGSSALSSACPRRSPRPGLPKHERLSATEVATVLAWHRFALRYRDLFLEGEDTSWYDVGDDNGAVRLEWDGPVWPEPPGGRVFARVVRTDDCISVGVVDLTGSLNGSWSEPTAVGGCQSVQRGVLLDEPAIWKADVAVLGRPATALRRRPLLSSTPSRAHRSLEVPLRSGWSVLRMTR